MEFDAQPELSSGGEDPARLLDGKHSRFTKHVTKPGDSLLHHCRKHLVPHQGDMLVWAIAILERYLVGAEEGRHYVRRSAQRPDDRQMAQLRLNRKAISGLYLHGSCPEREQTMNPGYGE